MIKSFRNPLISTFELAKLLAEEPRDLNIVNANVGFDPNSNKIRVSSTWDQIYEHERIPGAMFLNLNEISDPREGLPFMLPSLVHFRQKMTKLNIGKSDHIVFYGDEGLIGPCRAWWMFKVFGIENVQILNGTLTDWKNEGYLIEEGSRPWKDIVRQGWKPKTEFEFELISDYVVDMDAIKEKVVTKQMDTVHLIDTKGDELDEGEGNEYVTRQGTIPGAKQVEYKMFLDKQGRHFKSKEEILQAVKAQGIDVNKPITTTSSTGLAASVLFLGLYEAGLSEINQYDGSWSEWKGDSNNPISSKSM